MTTATPTREQIEILEGMIESRMLNTGESRDEACAHMRDWLEKRLIMLGA